ncbi:hypothetical protein [Micromonospora sp. 050-3]|uniref:hypothetical protein n=1 Tax=Micromonospora sp. 050-3 TaxID=2789265 RepID=UPI00397E59A4
MNLSIKQRASAVLAGLVLLVGVAITSAAPVLAAPAAATPVSQLAAADSTVTSINPYEWNTATPSGAPPAGAICEWTPGAQACFERSGDRWWVLDNSSDGRSVTASWTNRLDTYPGWYTVDYREGSCVNKLGAGNWGVCNKDYYENGTQHAYGIGSLLEWQACFYDSAAGTWHGCSSPPPSWTYNDQ